MGQVASIISISQPIIRIMPRQNHWECRGAVVETISSTVPSSGTIASEFPSTSSCAPIVPRLVGAAASILELAERRRDKADFNFNDQRFNVQIICERMDE
jgi:hypothetical protein